MHVALATPPTPANIAAIKAMPNGGKGATVQHPRGGNPKARQSLSQQLTRAGLPRRVVMTLHWVTATAVEDREPAAVAEVEPDDVVQDDDWPGHDDL